MAYDPISEISDELLVISDETWRKLLDFKNGEKFTDLPGSILGERKRLMEILDQLVEKLQTDLTTNPTKLWVMQQFQNALVKVESEDTEARENFASHLEEIMDILGIESSDGLLNFYVNGFE